MSLLPGTQLGPYQIVGPLGKGGMGEVYRADDRRLGRSVAIKVLPSDVSTDRERRVRFEREARAIAALNHPHICAIHDVGHQDGVDYLVMELLDGESLADRLVRGPLPFDEASPIALTVVETLAAVHERGLIHRDLKPANIFLTRHGVKLLDFGLARDVGPAEAVDTRLTQQGLVVGTPRYLAPEQLRGQAVDHRSDIFAAGAVIYEMLAGRAAFDAPTLVDILHAVAFEDPPALPPGTAPARLRAGGAASTFQGPGASGPRTRRRLRTALRAGSSTDTVEMTIPVQNARRPDAADRPPLPAAAAGLRTRIFSPSACPTRSRRRCRAWSPSIVRSSLSAGPATPSGPDLPALARQVQVDAVVTGSLLRAGNEVRVSAQLVAVPEGSLLWSHTIQAPIHDLFQLQDALTHAIVSALHVPLSAHDHRTLRQDVPASAEAYELFLRGNKMAADSSQWLEVRDLVRARGRARPGLRPGVGAAGPHAARHREVRRRRSVAPPGVRARGARLRTRARPQPRSGHGALSVRTPRGGNRTRP